jgi:hypothetical protein
MYFKSVSSGECSLSMLLYTVKLAAKTVLDHSRVVTDLA